MGCQETLHLTGDLASWALPVHTLPSLSTEYPYGVSVTPTCLTSQELLVHWCYSLRKPNPSPSSMAHLKGPWPEEGVAGCQWKVCLMPKPTLSTSRGLFKVDICP